MRLSKIEQAALDVMVNGGQQVCDEAVTTCGVVTLKARRFCGRP